MCFLLLAGFVTERGICEMGVVSSLLLVQSMVKLHIGLREGPRDGVLYILKGTILYYNYNMVIRI